MLHFNLRRIIGAFIFVSFIFNILAVQIASAQNDAGTGDDAGDTFNTASLISPGSYSSYTGEFNATDYDDYYRFWVNVGERISSTMDPPIGSNYDLYLYNPTGITKDSSATGGDSTEYVDFIADSSGYWRIYVYSWDSSPGFYWFSISIADADDSYEDNDASSSAATISSGTTSNLICLDDDWYGIYLYSNEVISVNANYMEYYNDLTLYYSTISYSSSPTWVDSDTTYSTSKSVKSASGLSGYYYIKVDHWNDDTSYSLTITISDADDSYEENDYSYIAQTIFTGTTSNLISLDDDWYKIYLNDNELITVTANSMDYDNDLFLYYSVSSSSSSPTWVDSDSTYSASKSVESTSGSSGYYYIKIDYWNDDTSYSLTVTISDADDSYEDNDVSSSAATITSGTTSNLISLDDDWYKVYLGSNKLITVTANSMDYDNDLFLYYSVSSSSSSPAWVDSDVTYSASKSVESTSVLSGYYYIKVDYWNDDTSYSLTVTIEDKDDSYEQNDYISSAKLLTGTYYTDLISIDDDWYKVYLGDYEVIEVTLSKIDYSNNLYLYFGTTGTSSIDSDTSDSTTKTVESTSGNSGYYYIKVNHYNDDLDYDVTITISNVDDQYEPNNDRYSAQTISPGSMDTLYCNDDDWYYINIDSNEVVEVTLSTSDTGFSLTLYNDQSEVVDAAYDMSDFMVSSKSDSGTGFYIEVSNDYVYYGNYTRAGIPAIYSLDVDVRERTLMETTWFLPLLIGLIIIIVVIIAVVAATRKRPSGTHSEDYHQYDDAGHGYGQQPVIFGDADATMPPPPPMQAGAEPQVISVEERLQLLNQAFEEERISESEYLRNYEDLMKESNENYYL